MSGLTNKQRVFVEAYLETWNASEAARRAGYSTNGANVQGSRLLTNASISAAIQARVADLTLSANEVLIRLAEHARSSFVDFFFIGEEDVVLQETIIQEGEKTIVNTATVKRPVARLDLEQAARLGKLHLVKKYKLGNDGVSIELYDAQAALELIGRHHNLFPNKVELSGKISVRDAEQLTDDELDAELQRRGALPQ